MGRAATAFEWHRRLSVLADLNALSGLRAGYARPYQRLQLLRNPWSLVENIFSSELPFHVSADGVPTARADQLALALEAHPVAGMRVGFEAFTRTSSAGSPAQDVGGLRIRQASG